jgi:cyclopropane fatty-acyl-phospholipid synthase-like methyltransferase
MLLDTKPNLAGPGNPQRQLERGGVADAEWQKLYRILGGHIFFETLAAAVQFDLFGLLKEHGPLNRAEIATRLNIDVYPARILLLGCTALELLKKSGEAYSNSKLADRLLVRSSPGNIVDVIEWQHWINYRAMYFFFDAIKANRNVGLEVFQGSEKTLYERLAHEPRLENIFQKAMQAISVQANAMLADIVDFSTISHLVDVGGGNGANVVALAKKHSHLRATVFDSPTVCQRARENFASLGLSDRLDAVAGNCFENSFPAGCDCILFCHFFTIWSEEQNRRLLKKCYESLPHNGKAMVFNMMQWDNESGPLTAAMGSPYFLTLATGNGMLYTRQEYQSWMRDAGFSKIDIRELPRDHALIVGTRL